MTVANQLKPTVSPALRRWLLATYVVGAGGLGVELLLTEHIEGIWQQLPLWLIAASLLTLVLRPLRRRVVLRGFQGLMVAVALCGLLGVYLHFEGKAEFKRELDPTLSGWALVWECLHTTPCRPSWRPAFW